MWFALIFVGFFMILVGAAGVGMISESDGYGALALFGFAAAIACFVFSFILFSHEKADSLKIKCAAIQGAQYIDTSAGAMCVLDGKSVF